MPIFMDLLIGVIGCFAVGLIIGRLIWRKDGI